MNSHPHTGSTHRRTLTVLHRKRHQILKMQSNSCENKLQIMSLQTSTMGSPISRGLTRVNNTCMMGVAPAASSGSACRMERKVSEPSKPKPDRKAPITGSTDSSRFSQQTRPCRYFSLNTLRHAHGPHVSLSLIGYFLITQKATNVDQRQYLYKNDDFLEVVAGLI